MYSKSQTSLSNVIFENYENMSFHLDTLSWFRANQSMFLLSNTAWLVKKTQILIAQSLIWPDPNIYPPGTTIISDYLFTGHGNLVIYLQISPKKVLLVTSGSDYFSASFA